MECSKKMKILESDVIWRWIYTVVQLQKALLPCRKTKISIYMKYFDEIKIERNSGILKLLLAH